ncbi:hypothetical protein [Phytohabitans kaempferiae]|uniref:Uncharacterized protein n=1 Tax=Phytohabitans kaempferiae TaxID=1620943 RepID=A0ABV6MFF3_9ACTN
MDGARPSPPTAALSGTSARVRIGRLVLMLIVGSVALLCAGGAGVAFVAYRDATEPNRTSPDVTVDNYLRSYLVERNDVQADLYVCEDVRLDIPVALRGEIENREANFNVMVRVSWGLIKRSSISGKQEMVEVELTVASFHNGQSRGRRTEVWIFEVVDQNGWRVCKVGRT